MPLTHDELARRRVVDTRREDEHEFGPAARLPSPVNDLPLAGWRRMLHARSELAIARGSASELRAIAEDLERRLAEGSPPLTQATHVAELVGDDPPDAFMKLLGAVDECVRPGATLGDLLHHQPADLATLPNIGAVAPWIVVQALIRRLPEC